MLQHSTDDQRKSIKNPVSLWITALRVNWKKWSWTTMIAIKSVKVFAWSIFSAKYPLWYSWQSHACMQPSVPAPPLSAVNTDTDFICPYYCFHLADVITVKLIVKWQDKAFLCCGTISTGKLIFGTFCSTVRWRQDSVSQLHPSFLLHQLDMLGEKKAKQVQQ